MSSHLRPVSFPLSSRFTSRWEGLWEAGFFRVGEYYSLKSFGFFIISSFPSAAYFFFATAQRKSTKKKAPPLANRSASKGLALRCYPSALLNCMALVVLPIVYQRFCFCAWLYSLLLFLVRQPHLRHNKGAINSSSSAILSALISLICTLSICTLSQPDHHGEVLSPSGHPGGTPI